MTSRVWPFAAILGCGLLAAGQIGAAGDGQLSQEQAIQQAVQRVAPSVVQVQPVGGLESVSGMLVSQAPTTGLVVTPDGFILSSAYNFVQKPDSILVRLPGGQQFAARLVARDRARMLVLLKIDPPADLPVPDVVPREQIEPGQWALALGKSIDSEQPSVSLGIISATNRIWGRAIQADAKVSPLNYGGPLVDIQGRVMGILAPMSPDADSEVSGSELYDSGIGFAVPLSDLMHGQLDRMKQGQDLHPGLLGVTLKGQNMYVEPALVGLSPLRTPAREAGIQVGDEIIELDGVRISRQVHLRHALGRRMAGDKVTVVVKRGDESKPLEVTLTDHIDPYEIPFLGVLTDEVRNSAEPLTIRYVYADSPAAKAGLKPGDRLQELDGQPMPTRNAWFDALSQQLPGDEVELKFERNGTSDVAKVTLSRQLETVPKDLPSRLDPAAAPDGAAGTMVELRLPDEPNRCLVYRPASVREGAAAGVLVWLTAEDPKEPESLLKPWRDACDARGMILVVPRPREAGKWNGAEVEVVRRFLEMVFTEHPVDPRRVAVGGYQLGGTLAYAFAFQHRERVRGVAAVQASSPHGVPLRGNDPDHRLEFVSSRVEPSPSANAMRRDIERFRKMRFPVIEWSHEGEPAPPDAPLASQILQWADSLDRL